MSKTIADQAGELADQAKAAVSSAAERTKEAADQAKDMADQATTMAKDAVGRLSEARDAAWDVAQKAGTQAREAADEAYRRGERAAQDLAARVEQQPLLALFVAGAIGYALAYLLHARR